MSAHRIAFSPLRGKPQRAGQETRHFVLLINAASDGEKLERLDRDRLVETFAALTAELPVTLHHGQTTHQDLLRFADPEDLEPAAVADQLGIVARLRELRRRLTANENADEAALELNGFLAPDPATTAAPAAGTPAPDSDQDPFASLLGSKRKPDQRAGSFVARLLAEEGESSAQPDYRALVEACDELVNGFVRQVLASPGFRRLEQTWRGVFWLASELDLDDGIGLWLLPVDFKQLQAGADLGTVRSLLARLRSRLDGETLEAVGVDAEFETPESLELLNRLAGLAAELDCVLLLKAPAGLVDAGATLALNAGYPGASEPMVAAWRAFREQDAAHHCAALLPRFLLRTPYGAKGEAVDLNGFEELDADPEHEQFLWINPVYALVYVLCTDTDDLTITDLPMPVFQQAGGSAIMPCAEAYLSEADVAGLHEQGVMALQSYRNRNAVSLSGLFPLA